MPVLIIMLISRYQCNHKFGSYCLASWLQPGTGRLPTCPMCRSGPYRIDDNGTITPISAEEVNAAGDFETRDAGIRVTITVVEAALQGILSSPPAALPPLARASTELRARFVDLVRGVLECAQGLYTQLEAMRGLPYDADRVAEIDRAFAIISNTMEVISQIMEVRTDVSQLPPRPSAGEESARPVPRARDGAIPPLLDQVQVDSEQVVVIVEDGPSHAQLAVGTEEQVTEPPHATGPSGPAPRLTFEDIPNAMEELGLEEGIPGLTTEYLYNALARHGIRP